MHNATLFDSKQELQNLSRERSFIFQPRYPNHPLEISLSHPCAGSLGAAEWWVALQPLVIQMGRYYNWPPPSVFIGGSVNERAADASAHTRSKNEQSRERDESKMKKKRYEAKG